MIVDIDVPFVDTRADSLALSLELDELPAEHVLSWDSPHAPVTIQMRVLSASHQVVVRTPDAQLIETVACLPGGLPLPDRLVTDHGGWFYRFASRTTTYSEIAFDALVDDLLARAGSAEVAVVGRYPGSPHATTGLALVSGPEPTDLRITRRLSWHTWHSYPQDRQIVWTTTALSAPIASDAAHGPRLAPAGGTS